MPFNLKSYNRARIPDLFEIGLFLIPFDNMVIAPSVGWATVSPLFFFAYICINIRDAWLCVSKRLLAMLCGIVMLQAMLIVSNGFVLSTFLDGLETLVLGLSFFVSLLIRYRQCNISFDHDGRVLFGGYICSFIYGVSKYTAIVFGAESVVNFFNMFEKRPNSARLEFSFTEASFISLHILGVLFLYSCLVQDNRLAKKMIYLGLCFFLMNLFSNGSTRCLVDLGVFIAFSVFRTMIRDKRHVVRNIIIVVLGVLIILFVVSKAPRLQKIFSLGIYADPSLGARWYRINACLHGFQNNPVQSLLGYGLGNLGIPFHSGAAQAYAEFRGGYWGEVNGLLPLTIIDSAYCLPVKLMGEFGVLPTVCLLGGIVLSFMRKHLDIWVCLLVFWIYIQFDSYAFYSIWILLFMCEGTTKSDQFHSFYDRLVPNKRKWSKDNWYKD